MNNTFTVTTRRVAHCGNQITHDVVRSSDGTVIRSGLWADYADAECALLNLYVAQGWSAAKYHQVRADVMRKVRAA